LTYAKEKGHWAVIEAFEKFDIQIAAAAVACLPTAIKCSYYQLILTISENMVAQVRRNKVGYKQLQEAVVKHKANVEKYGCFVAENKQVLPEGFIDLQPLEQYHNMNQQLQQALGQLYDQTESKEDFELFAQLEIFQKIFKEEFSYLLGESGDTVDEGRSMKNNSVKTCCKVIEPMAHAKQSSGYAFILSAVFSSEMIVMEEKEVKIKLKRKDLLSEIEHEYRMMRVLYEANHRLFVKPYALLKGWEKNDGEVFVSTVGEDLSDYCGIVMEQGIESLTDYLDRNKGLSRMHILSIVEVLVEIVIAAHKANIVLMDFKPSNVIRCLDENQESVWKAIDFDCSKRVGEPVKFSITAQSSSYELAQYILTKPATAIVATKAMDVCALGWIVWKLMNSNVSLWSDLGIESNETAILQTLASLTKEEVKKHIDRTFPGAVHAPLRRWLENALDIDCTKRPMAASLKTSHSLLGHKEITRTWNMDFLAKKIVEGVGIHTERMTSRVLGRIEELSLEMQQHFGKLEAVLDHESVSMALEGKGGSMLQLIALLEEQKVMANEGKLQLSALQAQMNEIGDLKDSLISTITETLSAAFNNVNQADKLDAILEMMQGMQCQLNEIQSLGERQLGLLGQMEKQGNFMPHLFCVVPEVKREKLQQDAFGVAKVMNFAMRMKDTMQGFVWARSRLFFICPVTMRMVPCGPDNKGYVIEMPTELVKQAVPVLKVGLLITKIALATQGLGNIVPNIADFLPSSIDLNAINGIMSGLSSLVQNQVEERRAMEKLENLSMEMIDMNTMRTIYSLVAKAEKEVVDMNSPITWKPKLTGLILTKSRKAEKSAWVSAAGEVAFEKFGEAAFQQIKN